MNVLVRKMERFGILMVQLIFGAIVMVAALIALPLGIYIADASLMTNPYILGVVAIGMLMFAMFAYFLFIRPYLIYRKLPEVLAESDGEFIYIHGKKEAKIPISDISDGMVHISYPFLFSKELIEVFIVFLFSEKYGDLIFEVPGYGSHRMRFVSNVKAAADGLIAFISGVGR